MQGEPVVLRWHFLVRHFLVLRVADKKRFASVVDGVTSFVRRYQGPRFELLRLHVAEHGEFVLLFVPDVVKTRRGFLVVPQIIEAAADSSIARRAQVTRAARAFERRLAVIRDFGASCAVLTRLAGAAAIRVRLIARFLKQKEHARKS